ncbi:MAG: Fic family protein [Nitrospinae bacterium]|nr:Fic family protein [Nitrospinota bacterium]
MHRYVWEEPQWPRFRWRAVELLPLLGRCRKRQGELLGKLSSIGADLVDEARAAILTAEAMQTSQIEGESLDIAAVRSSVAKRLGFPHGVTGKSADRYTDGLVEILLDGTLRFKEPMSDEKLHRWQAALFPTGQSGLRRIETGKYRSGLMQVVSGAIGKEKIHYSVPPPERIKDEMRQFFNWWEESRESLDGLLRAGIAHFYFVTLHPYDDGNGRLARALTDVALAQDERRSERFYSMSTQIAVERNAYYDALEQAQKSSVDVTDWLAWFLGCLERAMDRSEGIIGNVFYKARFWSRHASMQFTERQRKVVAKMLEAGPDGFEGGMTTRKYVSMTKTSRATAFREISDLVEKGVLVRRQGGGRSVSYRLGE